ncbi:hypothetical protein [Paenarthrobacter sp. JL.01a]|uniref:hypothetical protein n=1 Tax=Paenarthrobacter sp. JL.01a TaxID=2979324 RepID=UPI0021C7A0D0|nr:hypothetical protein [Paenarthrobacter sp. JL.01a]UXM92531.1 hypothetical protein N5P29_04175 [Paenarthrobacter sp. JL.01a]
MRDVRFSHTDWDGDQLTVVAGMQGAIIATVDCDDESEVRVAVRYPDLPALIEALQQILGEQP